MRDAQTPLFERSAIVTVTVISQTPGLIIRWSDWLDHLQTLAFQQKTRRE